jgi:3-hydroxy-3-methylglutaryl CoA synthase
MREGTRNWPGKTARAAANFDEDAVTMAVAAIADALEGVDRDHVEALYLASTTLPYLEKQSASLVAAACDLSTDIVTADFAHSLRSGTLALRAALDAVAAGSCRQVLVAAGDCRLGAAGSDIELAGGDGAAALLIGPDDGIARVTAVHSVVNDILDVWRPDGEKVLRAAEDRFRFEQGYLKAVGAAVEGLLGKTGSQINDFEKVVLYAPDARRHRQALEQLGVAPKRVQNPHLDGLGSTGTAFACMQLIAALEEATPGQRLLLVNYGDGADAIALETTPALAEFQRTAHRGIARNLASGATLPDYYDYLRWRGLLTFAGHGRTGIAPAPAALYREQTEVLRLRGVRCRSCGMVQYPPQRVCVRCQTKDDFDSIRLSGSHGKLFSYSMDYVAATPDVPLIHSVVDFDVGGRAMMMMADRDTDNVRIGMPLEPTFRKFSEADGIHTYIWKVAPIRD